jgi:hypothetical protein
MGKAAGIVGVVLGTIILIVGLFLLFVVFATNMHTIFAGQYLFLGVVIMAGGGYLIYKDKGVSIRQGESSKMSGDSIVAMRYQAVAIYYVD